MLDIVLRLGWLAAFVFVAAYVLLLIVGATVQARPYEPGSFVFVRDAIRPGMHHVSGMYTVDSTCTELSLQTKKLPNYTYELAFSTWKIPHIACEHVGTPRYFDTIIYAPGAGIHYRATLNGHPIDIGVLSHIDRRP